MVTEIRDVPNRHTIHGELFFVRRRKPASKFPDILHERSTGVGSEVVVG
jgi:hypothetical protein